MNVFGRRSKELQGLERELQHNRPEPRDGFVDEMLGRIPGTPAPRRSRSRVGLALAFALLTMVAFGAFGGLGYAKSAATSAVNSTTSAFSSVVRSGSGVKGGWGGQSGSGEQGGKGHHHGSKPGHHQYDDHVLICHHPPGNPGNSVTISVASSAVPAHLAHGDSLGRCSDDDD